MFQKIILVISGLILSVCFFYKAAGTLNIRKLNIVSYTFYLFLLQTYIGISLIFLGDRNHYTVDKIVDKNSINITFYFVLFTAILLPLVIIFTNKIFEKDIGKSYEIYMTKDTAVENEKFIFTVLSFFSIISIIAMIIMFVKIGYIPLLKIFSRDPSFNAAAERIKTSNLSGYNIYIKNIVVLTFIPIFSYLAFTYSYITEKRRWRILFIILFISSILVKTYNFAKSPLVFYIFTYIIIYSFINNGIKTKYLLYSLICLSVLIVGSYLLLGLNTSIFDIHNGPIGRTIYSQVGALIFHFDLFPEFIPFLKGKGFSNIITRLLGYSSNHIRSSRIVMLFYGSRNVYKGIAGVMNSFFIGEAYASFGFYGVVFSIVYIGILCSLIQNIFLKIQKDAINITLFSILTVYFGNASQGGFFDFIFNISIILIIGIFILIKYMSNFISKNENLNLYINTKIDKLDENL